MRPLLSDAAPEYIGTTFIEIYLHDADARHPAAAEAAGGGAMFALAPGQGIFVHRETGSVLHAYVALARPADWFGGINFNDSTAAKARVAAEFDGWAPALRAAWFRVTPQGPRVRRRLDRLDHSAIARFERSRH